jgi:hypothetical protein
METRKILTALAGEFSGPLLTEMADFVELGCGHESQVNTVIAHLTGTWAGCPRTLPEPSARMMPFMVIDARLQDARRKKRARDKPCRLFS